MEEHLDIVDRRGWFARALSDAPRGGAATAFRAAMAPPAALYGAALRLRRAAYRAGLLHAARLPAPVISVGNLTAGGVGKTPLVEWIVRRLHALGRRPAILSRGYGAPSADRPNDEALLLAQNLPDTPQIAHPSRLRAGRRALDAGADCLVLDDGFQHLRLHRDLEIVVVDATAPFGGGRCLPAGLLREPVEALAEADTVVLSHADLVDADAREALRRRVRTLAPRALLVEAVHEPAALCDLAGAARAFEGLRGLPVVLFCGLGNPQSFLATARGLGARVTAAFFFPDHHAYAADDLEAVAEAARRANAGLILTTQKDAVKIGAHRPGAVPLAVVRIRMRIAAGEDRLEALVRNVAQR